MRINANVNVMTPWSRGPMKFKEWDEKLGACTSSRQWSCNSGIFNWLLFSDGRRGAWAMEVDYLPLAVFTMPDPCLLWLGSAWHPVGVQILCDTNVGDAGSVLADQVDVRVQDGGVNRLAVLWPQVFKVEAMEIQPLHQVSQGLRLKRCNTGITHLL